MLDRILWGVGAVGQAVLLYVLLSRRLFRVFPWFTSFVTFCVIRSAALFLLRSFYVAYFYSYWSLAALDVVIELFVLGEAAAKIFRPSGELSQDVKTPLVTLGCVSILLAALVAWLADPPSKLTIEWVILRGDLFASVLISLVFVGLLAISVRTGFPWNTQVGAIARGFGVYAIVSIIYKALICHFGLSLGQDFYSNLSRAHVAGYMVCLAYWTICLLRRIPVSRALPKEVECELARLNSYANGLLFHLNAKGSSR